MAFVLRILLHKLEFSFPPVELVRHIFPKGLLCLRKLLNYLFRFQSMRSCCDWNKCSALVPVHKLRGVQETHFFSFWNSNKSMLVSMNQLAWLDSLSNTSTGSPHLIGQEWA